MSILTTYTCEMASTDLSVGTSFIRQTFITINLQPASIAIELGNLCSISILPAKHITNKRFSLCTRTIPE